MLYRLVDESRSTTSTSSTRSTTRSTSSKTAWRRRRRSSRAGLSELRHDLLRVRRDARADARRRAPRRRQRDRASGRRSSSRMTSRSLSASAYDKLLRAVDGLDSSRDLLAGVRDYLQAKVANDQNEVIKELTVMASLLSSHLHRRRLRPELRPHAGAPLAPRATWSWAVIVLVTVAQLVFFRSKKAGSSAPATLSSAVLHLPELQEPLDRPRRPQGLDNVPVACERCGFGFLFELMDDYYPAPNTGFVVCDQEAASSPPAGASSS